MSFARRVLRLTGLLVVAFVVSQGIDLLVVAYNQPKLDALYSVMRELRVGMPHGEVVAAMNRHATPAMEQHDFPNGDITVWVHYGLVDSCSLTIGFKDSVLVLARTVGEDGGNDKCPSAPPDLR